MRQRGFASLIVIIVLIAVGAVLFGASKYLNLGKGQGFGFGQKPGGAENFGGSPQGSQKPRWSGPVPTPPKDKITYYKGLWGAPVYPEEHTGLKIEPEKYKGWGINLVNISPGFEINSKGEVRYPPDFPTYEDMDARIGELATAFYKSNLNIGLTLTLTYKPEFSDPKKGELWAGIPEPFPKEVVEKPGYFNEYNKVVEDMAKIAQKYHAYLFSPGSEVDNIFGMSVAPAWTQKMVSVVKKQYKGKLYYKGDLHAGTGDQMNFKGYDILGFVTSPSWPGASAEELKALYDSNMDRANVWAKRDGVPEVVISEYGNMGPDKMESARNFGIILEEGSKKLNGVFVSEPSPMFLKTNQGMEIVSEIKRWFLK
ncbi:hypothetical protein MUP46_04265 [Patescibacteria group bacterium]|nr:hypothetical protein [Patescibacteria group bacterium]